MESDKIYKLLDKYFKGESTLDEERTLKKYFTEDKDIPSDLAYARELFRHLKTAKNTGFLNRKKLFVNRLSVAAGILILIAAGFFLLNKYSGYDNKNKVLAGKLVTYKNNTGTVQKITLSDNNVIWLNKNCEVVYPGKINGDINEISVNGEAYFDLVNSTGNYHVTANNTLIVAEKSSSFNIKAEANMPSTEITVDSGIVKVSELNNPEGLALLVKSGHYCSVHNSRKFIFSSVIKDENYKSWKTGEFRFENTYIATIASVLSEYYDVQIEFENRQLAYCEFSGNFKEKSLEHILNDIKSRLDLEITSTGDVITISGKGCM